jgi:hypothetical protein
VSSSPKLSLTLSRLLHICRPLVICSDRFVTRFPICLEGGKYYIQIDHACHLPDPHLPIICDYLFISFSTAYEYIGCEMETESFSNQRIKQVLFSCKFSKEKLHLSVNAFCAMSVLGWFTKWCRVACISLFMHSTSTKSVKKFLGCMCICLQNHVMAVWWLGVV